MSNQEEPIISVIVPVHNAAGTLSECLQAVHRSRCSAYEVVVVDDHSSDQSLSIARAFPNRIIPLARQVGPAAARNQGAAAARGTVLLFLDADVIVRPDTISQLAGALGGITAASIGAYDAKAEFPNFCSRFKNLWLCYMFHLAPTKITWFWSGCGAIRRDAFEEVGGFDEKLWECEDYALGYKITLQGKEILLNRAVEVGHRHCRSLSALLRNDFKRSRDNIKILLDLQQRQDSSFATGANAAGVLVLYTALLALALGWFSPLFYLGGLGLGILFLVLNLRFYFFIYSQTSVAFALKAIGLSYLVFLVMGMGALTGLGDWIYHRVTESSGKRALERERGHKLT